MAQVEGAPSVMRGMVGGMGANVAVAAAAMERNGGGGGARAGFGDAEGVAVGESFYNFLSDFTRQEEVGNTPRSSPLKPYVEQVREFVIPYKSPAPPAGTHRYTLSLWKQATGYVDVSDFNGYEYGNGFYERMYFDAQAFVSVNAFLDYPAVAAHYFNAAGPGANCTCPSRIP